MNSLKKTVSVLIFTLIATTAFSAENSSKNSPLTFDYSAVQNFNQNFTQDFNINLTTFSADSLADSIFQIIFDLASEMWQNLLMETRFANYPYQNDGKYISFSSDSECTRISRWSISTEFGSIPNFCYTNTSTFEGMLICIGPFVQNTILKDNSLMTGFVDLGGQLAIVHLNPVCLYVFAAVNIPYSMDDSNMKVSNANGTTVGASLKSYFKKPFILEGRISYTSYNESDYLFGDASLGYMLINRVELYGGWKMIGRKDTTVAENYQKFNFYHGFKGGLRLYF